MEYYQGLMDALNTLTTASTSSTWGSGWGTGSWTTEDMGTWGTETPPGKCVEETWMSLIKSRPFRISIPPDEEMQERRARLMPMASRGIFEGVPLSISLEQWNAFQERWVPS